MLEKIHFRQYMGNDKCKYIARTCLYWPVENKKIEDLLKIVKFKFVLNIKKEP